MKRLLPVLPVSLLGFSFGASAAVPTIVTDSLTAASTDAVTVGGLVIAIIVAVAALKFMRRAIS